MKKWLQNNKKNYENFLAKNLNFNQQNYF